jgi:hypothetical protein
VVQRPRGRRLKHGGGGDVGRCVLHVEEAAVAEGPSVEGNSTAAQRFIELGRQLRRLLGADERSEVQLGERIAGVLDREWVAESHGPQDRQVHLEEGGEQATLDDVAGIRGAPLFGVFKAFPNVLRQELPLGEVPYAPRVEAFLFEHVPPVGIGEGDGGSAAVRPPADEHEGPDSVGADQHVAQAGPHARNERDRKPGASHERMRQRERVEAALARSLRQHSVPAESLHQLGVDLHAHRIIPAGDVRDGPREGLPLMTIGSLELALDLPQVPTNPVDAAVDVGSGKPPGLADLPDEEQGEQVVVLAQGVNRSRDPGTAFVQIHLRPDVVLATRELDGRNRFVVIHQRRPGDRCAVNGVDVVPRDSDPAPLPTGQVP